VRSGFGELDHVGRSRGELGNVGDLVHRLGKTAQ
jgi:hypothetical protein